MKIFVLNKLLITSICLLTVLSSCIKMTVFVLESSDHQDDIALNDSDAVLYRFTVESSGASNKTVPFETTIQRWRISDKSDWINVTPTSGSGDSELIFSVSENTSDSYRIGYVHIVQEDLPPICIFIKQDYTIANSTSSTVNNNSENREKKYDFVDLGLSVKWATCNVGATKPEEYGDYFAWGELNTKRDYSLSTYKYSNGYRNGTTKLVLADDVVRASWGGTWRIPSKEEFDELIENCTWHTYYTLNGVGGYRGTSNIPGYEDKSIFFPTSGYKSGVNLYYSGDTNFGDYYQYGYYWCNSLKNADHAYCFEFHFNWNDYGISYTNSYYGLPIRPVCP